MSEKKVGKRLLTWVLVLIMALSMLPLNVLANEDGGDSVVYGHNDGSGWVEDDGTGTDPITNVPGVDSVSKTAVRVGAPEDNTYQVTLQVQMHTSTTTHTHYDQAATVLVIDTSGSMSYCLQPEHMFRVLNEKDEIYGMCRLCSGYAWEWTSKNDPSHPDIVLDGTEIWWNRQTGKWLRNPEAKLEMGSIYSLVGLDLNYAAVVIGPDLYYDRADQKIKVNKKHYFDNKVKTGGSDEELREYVLNTYAVLLTRGIYGTYVYVCDEALREYLQQYIPSLK